MAPHSEIVPAGSVSTVTQKGTTHRCVTIPVYKVIQSTNESVFNIGSQPIEFFSSYCHHTGYAVNNPLTHDDGKTGRKTDSTGLRTGEYYSLYYVTYCSIMVDSFRKYKLFSSFGSYRNELQL